MYESKLFFEENNGNIKEKKMDIQDYKRNETVVIF